MDRAIQEVTFMQPCATIDKIVGDVLCEWFQRGKANDSDGDNSPPRRRTKESTGEERVKAEPVVIKPDPDGDMSPPRKGNKACRAFPL